MRPSGLEVADIFRQLGPTYRQENGARLSRGQRRVMSAIERCRTAALGGHVEACDACGHQRIAFNSCRNRHCPKCQSMARVQWLEDRQAELLPVEYSHVVFTLPEAVAAITYQNKAVVYDILFQTTAQTLRTIRSIWARRSASSRSCIPGVRTCCITRTCTAWCPEVVWHPMANAG